MLKVGLTGGIGSGKTTVSDLFKQWGIAIIDTDIISRDLIHNHASVVTAIVEAFGENVLDAKGTIDRKKLAQLVFNDREKKKRLEQILHPRIRDVVRHQIEKFSSLDKPPPYLIIVVPLLFETGFNDFIDRSLVVMSDEAKRIERVKQRDNRSMDEIRSIISSQANDATRIAESDDIIENNNDFKQLASQVLQMHNKYKEINDNIK